jgi:hypothetical protein
MKDEIYIGLINTIAYDGDWVSAQMMCMIMWEIYDYSPMQKDNPWKSQFWNKDGKFKAWILGGN